MSRRDGEVFPRPILDRSSRALPHRALGVLDRRYPISEAFCPDPPPQNRHHLARIERNFAHQFDTGGLDRLYVRGKENVHKKFLIQAAACDLALLMLSSYGSGKPRAAHTVV